MALATDTAQRVYGDGTNSTIGASQLQDYYFQKKALIDLKKEQYFGALSSVLSMPKNMGKTIKRYHYMPMLDDRNTNDQGIDAAGALLLATKWYVFTDGALVPDATIANNSGGWASEAIARGKITDADDQAVTMGSGNLYGSSKDVGTIVAKMPALSEVGGRVNRVGFKRIELEGTFEKFGFFDEYTQESLDFDSDAGLAEHINREMLRGANEMTEDAIQIDLLNGASVFRFGGIAENMGEISGATGAVSEITYADFSSLNIEMDNNRTPKDTKILKGTRMTDTKTIPACRAMLIGSEMIPTIERMTDHFDNAAFIPLNQYAAGTTALNGEIGTVGHFRIVVVPEMMHWAGAGAVEGTNAGYQVENGKYNVYPMLVVGSESFTTIGFQTSGKSTKFKIFHKKPGYATADRNDPFGETGFMSIKWYYGMMLLRTEHLAICYSVGRI